MRATSLLIVSTTVDERSERPHINQANKNPITYKKEHRREHGDPLFTDSGRVSSEIPEWLQEVRENIVDDEILYYGDSHASISRTLPRQGSHCSTSSCSSSSSPTEISHLKCLENTVETDVKNCYGKK